jgi:hypothetical protein
MTETTIHGRHVRLLESWQAPGLVLDRWEDLDEDSDSLRRIGVVVMIVDGGSHSPDEDPNMPWAEKWAVGYTDTPPNTPRKRFLEAVRQERERALERLSEPVEFRLVYPRPNQGDETA